MPKAVSLTFTGAVGAPIDQVFALISDPARLPEWLPGCQAVRPAPNPKGKGDRHRILFGTGGPRQVEVEIEIIDYSPPTTFGWVELRRRTGSKTFFALQFQGGATSIRMKHVWTPPTWRSWLLGQFYRRRDAHRLFDALLQNLRRALTRKG